MKSEAVVKEEPKMGDTVKLEDLVQIKQEVKNPIPPSVTIQTPGKK
jgi:hypothetical protein